MNATRLLSILAVIVFSLVASVGARAQNTTAPSQQFGIGANTSGFSVQYAITPGVHAGLNLGLRTGEGSTDLNLSPFVKILLEGVVNPFFMAGLSVGSSSATVTGTTESVSTTTTALFGSFGLEYFISRNVGVWAGSQLLNLQLSPSAVHFGYFNSTAGVEWFFNR